MFHDSRDPEAMWLTGIEAGSKRICTHCRAVHAVRGRYLRSMVRVRELYRWPWL